MSPPVTPGRWLRATTAEGDAPAYCGGYTGADLAVEVDIWIPSETLAALDADAVDSSSVLFALWYDGPTDVDEIYLHKVDDEWVWASTQGGDSLVAVTPDTVQRLKVLYTDSGTTVELFVGGVSILGPYEVLPGLDEGFMIGALNAPTADEAYYFRHPIAGSAEGGTDYFDERFSSGDFSHADVMSWYDHEGDLTFISVVPPPPLQPPWPTLTLAGDELYRAVHPLAYDDANQGYALRAFCRALGGMLEAVDELTADTPAGPGWSQAVDIDRSPPPALGWLAQFVGVTLDPSLGDAAQRDWIRAGSGMKRGTPAAIAAAARKHLTGTQTVVINERDPAACPSEPAYGLTVLTFTDETPDPAQTEADIRAAKPAGLVLQYITADGFNFELLKTDYATFDDVKSTFATFDALRTNTP